MNSAVKNSGHSASSLEISSQLYIGDYFTDTIQFSAAEHVAFRRLLLHLWLRKPTDKHINPVIITGVNARKWRVMAPSLTPVLMVATSNIAKWKAALRIYDGIRLPPLVWRIVRTIALERDGYICQYCGSSKHLHVDHVIPLIRGGSNIFENLITSCGPCNQSKGSKLPGDWKPKS